MMKKHGSGARALALLAGLCLMISLLGGGALAVELDRTCSITVLPGNPELMVDLGTVELTVDAYQVAGLAAHEGSDGYTFNQLEPFNLEIPAGPDAETWALLAQGAAQIALSPAYTGTPASASGMGEIHLDELGAGLYLLMAYGTDLEEHQITEKDEAGNDLIVTVAQSSEYEYHFAPVLVAVPTKDADESGLITTANPGDWLYDAAVTLKPTREPRFGRLEIVKTLNAYGGQPVTFAFLVEAELDGKSVYSNAETIRFTGTGTQTLLVDKIPVGATVTVTEDPEQGPGYRMTATDADTPRVISAEEIASVHFTNTYEDTPNHGHAIVNSFVYRSEETGWEWMTIQDGGQ